MCVRACIYVYGSLFGCVYMLVCICVYLQIYVLWCICPAASTILKATKRAASPDPPEHGLDLPADDISLAPESRISSHKHKRKLDG